MKMRRRKFIANSAGITQNGSGLGISLKQEGGGQVTITQTSPGG